MQLAKRLIEQENRKIMTEKEKKSILFDALKQTFLKYDFNQAVCALKNLLEKGDYDYFTNGNDSIKYRRLLKENVTPDDCLRFIREVFPNNRCDNFVIINYCKNIFEVQLLKDFCEGCLVTCMNYDELQLKNALRKYIKDQDVSEFSRYDKKDINHIKNYRYIISKYDNQGIINIIKFFLKINDIDFNKNNDELIDIFIENLVNIYYKNVGNKQIRH